MGRGIGEQGKDMDKEQGTALVEEVVVDLVVVVHLVAVDLVVVVHLVAVDLVLVVHLVAVDLVLVVRLEQGLGLGPEQGLPDLRRNLHPGHCLEMEH